MMNTEEALAYINNFTWSESKLGLGRTRQLLNELGDPQKKLKFVHVAGSNGKGSTCAMIEAVLRAAGYNTGLYPSPYIEDFRESFQSSGRLISDEELCELTAVVKDKADKMTDHPTQFEIKTAIAMLFFLKKHCDIVVLETGLGGELDSTNVIDAPEAAVITNIGYEHTEYLGNTLREIASAKAGIIKSGSAVVSYDNRPEVMEVLEKTSKEKECVLYKTSEKDIIPLGHDLSGQSFKWNGIEIKMPLLGRHQLKNAVVALKTLEVLNKKGYAVSKENILKGFAGVKWPARFEVLRDEPLFILDGGHNEQCACALADILADYVPDKKFVFLFGVLSDKDYSSMIDTVAPYAESFVCVTPDSPRALDGKKLAGVIKEKGYDAVFRSDISEAVRECAGSEKAVLAFGSLYMAGEVRSTFRKRILGDKPCTI
ncbi:MAG TPA: bifunctional folylpolyglutamate synthase/dihydrofolate synthase [Candidatus Alectryocaccobium stercorigallinarum]|jgi:dihydrofolate synthase/folylpolyglutamate synthase|nr:bifunctional folylpolyglutamate synthase/dihydrofolate synthase [Candidatus Alectryocaccobium stercorigallinarum]